MDHLKPQPKAAIALKILLLGRFKNALSFSDIEQFVLCSQSQQLASHVDSLSTIKLNFARDWIMNTALRIASVGLLMLAGCAPTTMYTSGGYLTAHGVEQTSAEREKIMATCNSQFERTEPEFFDCMRDLIPLAVRFGDEYAEIMSDTIYAGRNVVLGYQAGNISQQSTIEALDEIGREFALQEKIWGEQYTRIVSARNAREKELARQRMGTALSNAGSDLLTQSYADGSKSISCTEIVSGTITCSQW